MRLRTRLAALEELVQLEVAGALVADVVGFHLCFVPLETEVLL